jgi:hypothetical protein
MEEARAMKCMERLKSVISWVLDLEKLQGMRGYGCYGGMVGYGGVAAT